ncbi:hypothetical protein TKK_0003480 [Trichogramma kaykai]
MADNIQRPPAEGAVRPIIAEEDLQPAGQFDAGVHAEIEEFPTAIDPQAINHPAHRFPLAPAPQAAQVAANDIAYRFLQAPAPQTAIEDPAPRFPPIVMIR